MRNASGKLKMIVACLLIGSALLLLAGCGLFGDKGDDKAEIQGEWRVDNANMTFVITSNQFKLPGDTTYDYTIDAEAGTIDFKVGKVKGCATYTLGENAEGVATLTLVETLDGVETVTTFTKMSDDTTCDPVILPAEETPSTEDGAAATGTESGTESIVTP
ncbi:MAG: hypothetical protein HGA54_01340 [Actinobacteria bacterium]|nr:hypothetical protein [Actinomycetota bacterium]